MGKLTDAQKAIPEAEHLFHFENDEARHRTRANCSCGWRGTWSHNHDGTKGQFATHKANIWRHHEASKQGGARCPST